MRNVGTIVRGIRTPIIKEGDNLKDIVVESVINASKSENFEFYDRDVVAITEAVVGISNGNYATIDDIATDIKNKFNTNHLGITFPILSRNRFALLLKAIARSMDKLTILLSYPSDEVGNHMFDPILLEKYNLNPTVDVLNESEYRKYFGNETHVFTGVNYVDLYKEIVESENCEVEFVFSNKVETILKYTDKVLCCDIHTREFSKRVLKLKGCALALGLDDILTSSVNGSGYNEKYGLLGSNRSTEERVKLFPQNGQKLVDEIQAELKSRLNKNIEVMIYGDGAFKDPVGKIWELADPVVSPAYTQGLEGSPNELKLKYLSDNKFQNLKGEDLSNAIKEEIRNKETDLKNKNVSLGTTPRRYTDLIGSLADLTSGSGDKGTPVVLIQRYFVNYSE
jgi:F420-0:gamma-glutamyl ligase